MRGGATWWSGSECAAAIVMAFILSSPSSVSAADHVIRIVSDYENLRMNFDPKYLLVEPGDRVTWINEADEEHNVITYPDGYPRGADALRSPIMTRAGEQWSYEFEVSGTYEYHCIPHLPMGMHGLIIVGRASGNDEFHEPTPDEIAAYRRLMLEWFDDEDLEELENENRASAKEF